MSRSARWLLLAGVSLFGLILVWQGIPAVLATLSSAGYGLLLVALLHLLPLALDAAAAWVFFDRRSQGASLRDAVLTRWVGESANSLLPAGQLGGPVLMVRQFVQRGVPLPQAAAVITVNTTNQLLAQMIFALMGIAALGASANYSDTVRASLLISVGVLACTLAAFYLVQRRGLFRSTLHPVARFLAPRNLADLMGQADAVDQAVRQTYGRRRQGMTSFALNLLGWLVGTAEVYLILRLIRHPVSWQSALVLESLGQAIRGAGFAIPGSLGVQEGGYILLAPLAGLQPELALALSLAKRAREILLGVPGLMYLQLCERRALGVRTA
jgi:putative membrane protein